MRVLLASIAIAATAISAPAYASSVQETVTAAVPYADLNLNNPAGVAALEGRIRGEARRLCGSENHLLKWIAAAEKCRADAEKSAQAQLRFTFAASSGGFRSASR